MQSFPDSAESDRTFNVDAAAVAAAAAADDDDDDASS